MLLKGNCLDTLKTLADNSVDSVVTDPPYELGFMGKSWDASGIAYNAELWRECLRVLKPGGHLLAFGGSRTVHRIAVAIEDAGFEIRDSIHWTYGSGFPKSLDISKAIDRAEGLLQPESKRFTVAGRTDKDLPNPTTKDYVPPKPQSDEAQQWQGWGTALKPSHEPIVVARKPLIGTVAANVLEYGTGGLNIDGTRVGSEVLINPSGGIPNGSNNYVTTKPRDRNKPPTTATGRWPANTVITHHPDCEQVGTRSDTLQAGSNNRQNSVINYGMKDNKQEAKEVTVPVWNCAEGCPVLELDRQSGVRSAGHWAKTKVTGFGEFGGGSSEYFGPGEKSDTGGASRYFTQTTYTEADYPAFLYYAKASKRERNQGLEGLEAKSAEEMTGRKEGSDGLLRVRDDGSIGENPYAGKSAKAQNFHPTVKPVELMRHLIRLVTPPNGTVLDPFLGSGTTAVAAILEGKNWVGCELTEDYWPIIEARTAWAQEQTGTTLF